MALAFQSVFFLWFLLVIPLIIVLHLFALKKTKKKALKFANFEAISRATGTQAFPRNLSLLSIRILIIILMVLAISGTSIQYTGRSNEFDVVLAIDASSSMTADDLEPNRLEVAKEEAINFINSLGSKTNIAVVSFSGTVSVEEILTDDLSRIRFAIRSIIIRTTGGTNLGEAIQTGVNILIPSQKGKMIVLLTDGRSNSGPPIEEAVDYANQNDVIIHTIGIGTEEGGKIAGLDTIISTLDARSLNNIAISTDGRFFLAEDQEALASAYKEISSTSIKKITTNISSFLLLFAIVLLVSEWFLANTRFRTLP